MCPGDFIKNVTLNSCYKVFSPANDSEAKSVPEAQQHCQQLHPKAKLTSIDTPQELSFVKYLLSFQPSEWLLTTCNPGNVMQCGAVYTIVE